MKEGKLTRRELLSTGATGAAALMLSRGGSTASPDVPTMPTRPLGLTGHNVKLFSLGGQATLETDGMQTEAEAIINRAIDLGVNYIDTAASYGTGQYGYPVSQTHIGGVMATRRNEVFLASKTHDRTRDGSLALLDQSLTLLQTDHLDLWQIHNIKYIEELDQVFGPGGAIEALQIAKGDSRVRFLGITGHFDPDVLIEGIRRFDFDCLLTAANAADAHYLPFARRLLPLANEKQMGVIGMKVPARGRIFRPDGITTMAQAMGYTLSLPVSTVIVGCDTIQQLEENIEIARSFNPMNETQLAELEQRAEPVHKQSLFFRRWDA